MVKASRRFRLTGRDLGLGVENMSAWRDLAIRIIKKKTLEC